MHLNETEASLVQDCQDYTEKLELENPSCVADLQDEMR